MSGDRPEYPPAAPPRTDPLQCIEVASKIATLLEPFTAGGRARVMLTSVLMLRPCPVDDDTLQALLQAAKQP